MFAVFAKYTNVYHHTFLGFVEMSNIFQKFLGHARNSKTCIVFLMLLAFVKKFSADSEPLAHFCYAIIPFSNFEHLTLFLLLYFISFYFCCLLLKEGRLHTVFLPFERRLGAHDQRRRTSTVAP